MCHALVSESLPAISNGLSVTVSASSFLKLKVHRVRSVCVKNQFECILSAVWVLAFCVFADALWDCTVHKTSATYVCAIRWASGILMYPEGSEGFASCPYACKQAPRTRPPSLGWTYYDSLGPASDASRLI